MEDKKKNQGTPMHLAVTLYCFDDVNVNVNENKWLKKIARYTVTVLGAGARNRSRRATL